jgi:hypothetical protein
MILAGKVRQFMPVQDAMQFASGRHAGQHAGIYRWRIVLDTELTCEKRPLVQ